MIQIKYLWFHGDCITKIVLNLMAGWFVSPVFLWLEKYVYQDWEFLRFLLILIVIDTILGFWKNVIRHTVSSKGFARLFKKCIIYSAFLILVHNLTHFTIKGEVNWIFKWFDTAAYTSIVVREAISILENIGVIHPDLIPNWILRRFKEYEKTGSIGKLSENDK